MALATARRDDGERLAIIFPEAKLTYRAWAPAAWQPPRLDMERLG
jgi:hypothetical protein